MTPGELAQKQAVVYTIHTLNGTGMAQFSKRTEDENPGSTELSKSSGRPGFHPEIPILMPFI